MARRNLKPFEAATRVANTMLVVDIAFSVILVRLAGKLDIVSLLFAVLPPAWSALVLALILTWVKSLRPTASLEFPMNVTYPLLSAGLLNSLAVLTCSKSPSIVALETEASSLQLWTNYPIIVLSAFVKVIVASIWLYVGNRLSKRDKAKSRSGE